jgi:hypothetical protein
MTPFVVWTCSACATTHFPRPELCSGCGGRSFAETPAPSGRVARITRHRDTPVAAIVLDTHGLVVLARGDDVAEGDEVALELDGGAPVATPIAR